MRRNGADLPPAFEASPPAGPGPSTNPLATNKSTPEACVGKMGIHKVNGAAHLTSRHTIPPQ